MKKVTNKKFGEILITLGLINENQLREALDIQKKTGGYLGEILLNLGFIKEENFAYAITLQYGQDLPFINLERYNINPEVIGVLPREFVARYRVIPVDRFRDILTVATANPDSLEEVTEKLHGMVDVKLIEVLLTTHQQIDKTIARYYAR